MLEAVWILMFPSLIIQFPLLITQKWWDPWRCSPFRFVFKYCFHHLILTFLSNESTKLKQVLGVFELWKLSYDGIFLNTHTYEGPMVKALSPQVLLFITPPTAPSHHKSNPHKIIPHPTSDLHMHTLSPATTIETHLNQPAPPRAQTILSRWRCNDLATIDLFLGNFT